MIRTVFCVLMVVFWWCLLLLFFLGLFSFWRSLKVGFGALKHFQLLGASFWVPNKSFEFWSIFVVQLGVSFFFECQTKALSFEAFSVGIGCKLLSAKQELWALKAFFLVLGIGCKLLCAKQELWALKHFVVQLANKSFRALKHLGDAIIWVQILNVKQKLWALKQFVVQ